MGYATKYNEEVANRILELYSSGKTLQTIEKEPGIPTRRTIINWRINHPEFGRLYEEALLSYTECIIEEALRIADTEQDAKKAKNRIDIRTWIASKYNRARFGDKIDVNHNITIDIAPALVQASKRLESLGTLPLIEAKAKQINSP